MLSSLVCWCTFLWFIFCSVSCPIFSWACSYIYLPEPRAERAVRFPPLCSVLKGICVELAAEKGNGTHEAAESQVVLAAAVGPRAKCRQSQRCLSSRFRAPERGELGIAEISSKKIKPRLPWVGGLCGVYSMFIIHTMFASKKMVEMVEGASCLGRVLLRQKTSAFLGPQGAQTE